MCNCVYVCRYLCTYIYADMWVCMCMDVSIYTFPTHTVIYRHLSHILHTAYANCIYYSLLTGFLYFYNNPDCFAVSTAPQLDLAAVKREFPRGGINKVFYFLIFRSSL